MADTSGHDWITSADILGVRQLAPKRQVTPAGVANSPVTIVPPQTILVVTRVGLGKVAVADRPLGFSQDVQGLIHSQGVLDPAFSLYYLSFGLERLKFAGRGTTIAGITKKQLGETRFPIPPLAEQRRIVAKIEELFSELDKASESLTTAREQLKTYRETVLKHAFEGNLASHRSRKNSWPRRRLGELIEFLTSGSRGWADYYFDHGDLFIRAQNLKHDRLDLSDAVFVCLPKGKTEGVRTRVHFGDILVTITGANVTKTALVDRELGTAYVSQHVALCRLTSDLLPEFLYWYLLSQAGGRRQLNEAAYGAGKPGLNLDNIRSVVIPVPSLAEQKVVVTRVAAALEFEARLNGDVSAAQDRAHALRKSILKRAFSGRLVAQDPSDEPACVVLERMRVEQDGRRSKERRSHTDSKKEAA